MGNIHTLSTKFKKMFHADTNCYSNLLKYPYFISTFHSNANFNTILEELESSYGGTLIKKGRIVRCNHNTIKTCQLCFILIWNRDLKTFGGGQGFYFEKGYIMTPIHIFNGYMTTKHIFNSYKNKVFVLFPTKDFCLIYNIDPSKIILEPNYDIARVKLLENNDQLPDIKPIELGQFDLKSGDECFFFVPKKKWFTMVWRFEKVKCKVILLTDLNDKMFPKAELINKTVPNEVFLSKAGNKGNSGTPIFSTSVKKQQICVGIYVAAIKNKDGSEIGIFLQFPKTFIDQIH